MSIPRSLRPQGTARARRSRSPGHRWPWQQTSAGPAPAEGASGRTTPTRAPPSGRFSAKTRPPRASARSRTMARPSPSRGRPGPGRRGRSGRRHGPAPRAGCPVRRRARPAGPRSRPIQPPGPPTGPSVADERPHLHPDAGRQGRGHERGRWRRGCRGCGRGHPGRPPATRCQLARRLRPAASDCPRASASPAKRSTVALGQVERDERLQAHGLGRPTPGIVEVVQVGQHALQPAGFVGDGGRRALGGLHRWPCRRAAPRRSRR